MHHFIYPSSDTYVTNRNNFEDKNFGIDEILQIGTTNQSIRTLMSTKRYSYSNTVFNSTPLQSFTGIFTGSIVGSAENSIGYISGSNLLFSISYFTGDVDGIYFEDYSGSIMGATVSGSVSGSFLFPNYTGIFTGELTGSNVCLTGTGTGTNDANEYNWTTEVTKYVDRTLIKFDITEVSKSIVSGNITNPKFGLKLKVCNEYDLPINYTIYALPVSQSWNMGDGYFSDGGSDTGVSWTYRDNNYGTEWYSSSISGIRPAIDFISNPSLSTASFSYGGGTWYTSSVCSQSFSYESSDINMDVTSIVMDWLNGNYANEGIMLIHSDELQSTGSGFILKFYSRDTNSIYSPCLDVKWLGNSNGLTDDFITGSSTTASVTISYASQSFYMNSTTGSTIDMAGGLSGSFSGSSFMTWTPISGSDFMSGSGFVYGRGLTGNIYGFPVYGFISASATISQSFVTGSCGNIFETHLATGSFYTGMFSGSTFTAYYVDYKFENAIISGLWSPYILYGTTVSLELPSTIYPYTYANITGYNINSTALGLYTLSGSTSASFDGQITSGTFYGAYINLQLTGSYISASYYYTSSVSFTSSLLTALNVTNPFSININTSPTYKAGDIVKFTIFSRTQIPAMSFELSTQLGAYVIPQYLPKTSYYALKDNETGEIIVDFDDYTALSCEYPGGNYFILDTTSLPQERYYKILIRVKSDSQIYTIDTGKTFKIIR